jgi:hypothetical protein
MAAYLSLVLGHIEGCSGVLIGFLKLFRVCLNALVCELRSQVVVRFVMGVRG